MRLRLPLASLARAICSGVRITRVRLCFMPAFPDSGIPTGPGAGPAPTGSTTASGAARSAPVRDSRWNVPPIGVERRGRPLSGVTGRHRPWPACRHRVRQRGPPGPRQYPISPRSCPRAHENRPRLPSRSGAAGSAWRIRAMVGVEAESAPSFATAPISAPILPRPSRADPADQPLVAGRVACQPVAGR